MGQEALKIPVLTANLSDCRPGGGMADTEDSKSSALTGVRVQIPLRAPDPLSQSPARLVQLHLACDYGG